MSSVGVAGLRWRSKRRQDATPGLTSKFSGTTAPQFMWVASGINNMPHDIIAICRERMEKGRIPADLSGNRGKIVGLLRRLTLPFLSRQAEWLPPDAVLNAAPDGIVIVNAKGEIVVVNSQTEVLFGYSREELIGKPVEMLIPRRFRDGHLQHRASFSADPHIRPMGRGLELFGRRKDGKEFPVEISLSPLRTAAGVYVISTIRDVSERKQAEEKIKKLNFELAEALRRAELLGTTGDLVTTIAHDIEICVSTLRRLLSILERHPNADDEMKEVIVKAREELDLISQTTNQALALKQQHDVWNKT